MGTPNKPQDAREAPAEPSDAEAALAAKLSGRRGGIGSTFGRVLFRQDHYAIGRNGMLYVYVGGRYVPAAEYLDATILRLADEKWTESLHREVVSYLKKSAPGLDELPPGDVINVANGIVAWDADAKRWRLCPHTPDLRTTYQLPVRFDPRARCPQFDAFIESSMPDEDSRKFADEWYGYNIVPGEPAEQKALMLVGESGSGKSVWLGGLRALLGMANVEAIHLQSLTENRFKKAELYGKLANIAADISSAELRNTSVFKELTGDDMVSAELKNVQEMLKFVNRAKLSFSANEIPATSDTSPAFYDRWLVLRWPFKFRGVKSGPRKEKVGLLKEITSSEREMSGVLNRALAGLTRLREQGGSFTVSESMKGAHLEFRHSSDHMALFTTEILAKHKVRKRRKRRGVWYQEYIAWCTVNRCHPLGARRFYARWRAWHPTDVSVTAAWSKGYEYFTLERVAGRGSRR